MGGDPSTEGILAQGTGSGLTECLLHASCAGEVPRSLRKHRNRRSFTFGVTADGAPIPPYKFSGVVFALFLGYLDLGTDVSTLISYYQANQMWWFAIGLVFVVGPALVAAKFVLRDEDWWRRGLVVLHLGMLWEAFASLRSSQYSHVLATLATMEPLYEAAPQLMLQMYTVLLDWGRDGAQSGRLLFSIVVSCLSLARATTSLVAEHPLSQLPPAFDVPIWRVPCLAWLLETITGLAFGALPKEGSVDLDGCRWPTVTFVWAFLLYQGLEIWSKFFSLALLALVFRGYFLLVLVWLGVSRYFVLHCSLDEREETLRSRTQLRLVGTPFMDSVMDAPRSYDVACALTTVEFIVCATFGNMFSANDADQVPQNVRHLLTYVAAVCMAGKLVLGFLVVRPFKRIAGFGLGGEQKEQVQVLTIRRFSVSRAGVTEMESIPVVTTHQTPSMIVQSMPFGPNATVFGSNANDDAAFDDV